VGKPVERGREATEVAAGHAVANGFVLLGVAGAIGLLFAPEFAAWWREWQKPHGYYSHGPVVPVLAAVLIWIDWERLKRVEARPSLAGLALVVPAILLLFLCRWSQVFFLSGFAWMLR